MKWKIRGGRESPQILMDRILVWNVRRINKQQKHIDIKNLINSKQAGLVSLLETKIKNKYMGKAYLNLFSGWCFTSNNVWLDKGRIIVAWNPAIFMMNILSCSSQKNKLCCREVSIEREVLYYFRIWCK